MTDRTPISAGVVALPAIQSLAKTYDLDAKAFAFTFKTTAMPANHSDAEFVSCCLVAREHGLNPLTKEIYFMRTRAGQIQPIVGVDGWIRKCNEHPAFDGMEFEDRFDDKGDLVSMTCVIYRKDRTRPIKVTEYLDECIAVGGAVWKSSPKRMLRNRVLSQGARIAFGFAGVMLPDEFEAWQGDPRDDAQPKDITPAREPAQALTEIPDLPTDEPIPDLPVEAEPVEDDDIIADADGVINHIREDLEAAGDDPGIRDEVLEQYESLIARLPRNRRAEAEALFA